MSGFQWTPRAIRIVREMWEAGAASSAIAAEIGATKNSVLGKVHRLKLPARLNPSTRSPESYKRPKGTPAPSFTQPEIKRPAGHAAVRDTFDALGLTIYRARVPASAALPIPRGAVGPARTCQWTDAAHAPWTWCGAPSLAGYSWCAEHNARVFKKIGEVEDVGT